MADKPFPNAHEYEGVYYGGVYSPEVLDRCNTFEFRADDVLLAGYPKSGRLWLEEIVWLLQNDADFEEASKTNVRARVMPIEIKVPGMEAYMDKIEKLESPRLVSTFLYNKFFKEQIDKAKPKVIVALRNPKDVSVAYYHFYRMCGVTGYYKGSFPDFLAMAKSKRLNLGDWYDHVLGWWGNHGQDNYLFIHYEDMVTNPRATIKQICRFLGKNYSDDVIDKLVEHGSFEKMRVNKSVNMEDIPAYDFKISPFLRKGIVGDWKNYFSAEETEKFQTYYDKMMKGSGLEFKFE